MVDRRWDFPSLHTPDVRELSHSPSVASAWQIKSMALEILDWRAAQERIEEMPVWQGRWLDRERVLAALEFEQPDRNQTGLGRKGASDATAPSCDTDNTKPTDGAPATPPKVRTK